MIRTTLRKAVGFVASPGLAIGLIVFVGGWSLLATLVPQANATSPVIVAWAADNPFLWSVIKVIGLQNAFSSPVFLAAVGLLGLATAVCAWRRTKVAVTRSRALMSASGERDALVASHDFAVACAPGVGEPEALALASDVLAREGIRARVDGRLASSVSGPWSVWGSTVFHWALVGLVVVILVGQMVRSEGSMALAVTEAKPDVPASYVSLTAGAWHGWDRAERSIRVDAFEPAYKLGGIDRGAVPTVSVLDAKGAVVASQRVYPNNMLHTGSLAINVPTVGLSIWMESAEATGTQAAQIIEYADFSQTAAGGTVPLRALTRKDAAGNVALRMYVTVPLDRSGEGYGEWVPAKPTARLRVFDAAGEALLDKVVKPDETVSLPGGGSIKLLGVGWYSRLSLVDDPTIPLVYTMMVLAMLGLTMTLVFRQQLVLVAYDEGPDGGRLLVRLRLWRNVPTNRSEIERELRTALSGDTERGAL